MKTEKIVEAILSESPDKAVDSALSQAATATSIIGGRSKLVTRASDTASRWNNIWLQVVRNGADSAHYRNKAHEIAAAAAEVRSAEVALDNALSKLNALAAP